MDKRVRFLSSFSGSFSTVVITPTHALLWTDGRYHLQASRELSRDWTLMRLGIVSVPTRDDWLLSQLSTTSTTTSSSTTSSPTSPTTTSVKRIGYDPMLMSISALQALTTKLAASVQWVPMETPTGSLIDYAWANNRPSRPFNPPKLIPSSITGQSTQAKLTQLRHWMHHHQPHLQNTAKLGYFCTMLDEIAWILNMRSTDVPYNPYFFSYLYVSSHADSILFTNAHLAPEVKQHLDQAGVHTRHYDDWNAFLTQLDHTTVFVGEQCHVGVQRALELPHRNNTLKLVKSPIQAWKSIKNPTELNGFTACHIQDAAALCMLFGWIERQLHSADSSITEVQVAEMSEQCRTLVSQFEGLSFDSIVGSGPNGAIIHYKPEPDTCAIIDPNQILLVDSGGHYTNGTTDVTRTYLFAPHPIPPPLLKKYQHAFTAVLKAHLALTLATFPPNTTGYKLDPLARAPLWAEGLDYRHGTGHGVGHFLGVHEGPMGISHRKTSDEAVLKPGQVLSIEPGYYQEGEGGFGIRIENLAVVVPKKTPYTFGLGTGSTEGANQDNTGKNKKEDDERVFRDDATKDPVTQTYLGFETLTLVPYGRALIHTAMLTHQERHFLNAYHATCLEKVGPVLKKLEMAGNEHARVGWEWLIRETQPL